MTEKQRREFSKEQFVKILRDFTPLTDEEIQRKFEEKLTPEQRAYILGIADALEAMEGNK